MLQANLRHSDVHVERSVTDSCARFGKVVSVKVHRLPIAFALRSTWTYRRVLMAGGSAAIASIAGVWLIERVFNVPLLAAIAMETARYR